MVSCFNLPFSGNISPYLFTICAAASVKCLFIIGGDFSIGLSVFAYWISGTPYKSQNWILCSSVLLISLWLAFMILYSSLFWWTEVLILMQIDPSFLPWLACFPSFMLLGLWATSLGQETHRGQNLLWVLVHLSGFPFSHLVIPYECVSMLVSSRWLFLIHLFFSCPSVRVGLNYTEGY